MYTYRYSYANGGHNMSMIIKRNGNLQQFDDLKIINAIQKSARRCCVVLSDNDKKYVVNTVKDIIDSSQTDISVKEVHNLVECALDKVNAKVANSYREYRNYKKEFSFIIDRVYNKRISLANESDRSNANADSSLVTTQKAIIYNELNALLYDKFFLNDEERSAVSDGYIYIHDKGCRFDSINCCLFDMENVLKEGFFMGNLDYSEPKTLDVAFDLIADVAMNAASSQYGGFTIPEVDKLLGYYAKKSYNRYCKEFKQCAVLVKSNIDNDTLNAKADEYAWEKVVREAVQGVQGLEMKFNSVASSRGDYPFTAVTFGLGTNRFETLISSTFMKVRKGGQGKEGFKHPVLFPKLSFFYDEEMHGEGKEFEWLFDEAIDCSSKTMYPDFVSLTGKGYQCDIYKKYKVPISRMGCRAQLSPWFVNGGFEPKDENDYPVFNGRFNMGAITLHFPMIVAKAKEEKKDFFEVLHYYLDMTREIHKRTVEYLSHKKAGTNPLGFCQGGFLNGHLNPDQEIGKEFLKPMTISFGVIALNEASVLQTGKSIAEDNSFAISVLKYMNEYIAKYKKIDGIAYALYGTPGESLVHRQIKQFRAKYGIIKDVSDHEYTTNSFHCCVRDEISPIQKQDIEAPMYHLCTGGNIQYCRYPLQYNIKAIKALVRRAMDLGFYEGVNLQLDYCSDCGTQFIDMDKCPKCGSEDIVRIERMNGYLGYTRIRGRSMYSDERLVELSERISM